MKTTAQNTKSNLKTSANNEREGKTMNTTAVFSKEVLETCKAHFTETATLKTKKVVSHKRFDKVKAVKGFNSDFDMLQAILKDISNVTMTKKNIRVKVNATDFIYIWRRAKGVRVYTNKPARFVGIEWQVYENENEPYTHVANTTATAIIKALNTCEK